MFARSRSLDAAVGGQSRLLTNSWAVIRSGFFTDSAIRNPQINEEKKPRADGKKTPRGREKVDAKQLRQSQRCRQSSTVSRDSLDTKFLRRTSLNTPSAPSYFLLLAEVVELRERSPGFALASRNDGHPFWRRATDDGLDQQSSPRGAFSIGWRRSLRL
jgi:hypothetical protein